MRISFGLQQAEWLANAAIMEVELTSDNECWSIDDFTSERGAECLSDSDDLMSERVADRKRTWAAIASDVLFEDSIRHIVKNRSAFEAAKLTEVSVFYVVEM